MFSNIPLLFAVATTALSVLLLVWYLFTKPSLNGATKIVLLFGIGLLPLATAANGNVTGWYAMKKKGFCGDCHTMTPYQRDAEDLNSKGLAARHSRNVTFGEESCYTCHADYGMFGTLLTKWGGMGHVYYYLAEFRAMSIEEALPKVHIKQPFPNATCMRCHSTQTPYWNEIGDHASTLNEIRTGQVSCASAGCHGAAHPFSHEIHERERAKKKAAAPAQGPAAGSATGGTP